MKRRRAGKPPRAAPARTPRAAAARSGFSVALATDAETGWPIVTLAFRDPRRPGQRQEAKLAPSVGCNLFSWMVDGQQLLRQPEPWGTLPAHHAGTPLMYPTVNRVRDARMIFEGRDFVFHPNLGADFIHGLARDCAFALTALFVDAGRAAVAETTLDWNETQPLFARFPIRHRLTMRHSLRASGLLIGYQVDNLDRTRMPYGLGLHPYFCAPARRSDVSITVAADAYMEAHACLPTGVVLPVEGTALDLRRGAALSTLTLDDAYCGMTPAKAARFDFGPRGLKVTLTGSDHFTHLVIYTPPDQPYFCLENQTSATDAHNLWNRGLRTSHLLVVDPGGRDSGEVSWTVRRPR